MNSFRKALSLKPDLAGAHLGLGITLGLRGNSKGAIPELREALRLGLDDDDALPAHMNLGLALEETGDLDGAIASFRRALSVNTHVADAHFQLGLALERKGEQWAALEECRSARRLASDNAEIKAAYERQYSKLNASIFSRPGSPAGSDNSVELLPRWKAGEKLHFEMVYHRQESEAGKIRMDMTARTDLDIEVLKGSDEGYLLRWTFGETSFDSASKPPEALTVDQMNSLVQQLATLFKGSEIILELDSNGSINGVQNWREIKDAAPKQIDQMIEVITKQVDPTKEAERQELKAFSDSLPALSAFLFDTKEQIEELSTQEAQQFFKVLGRIYTLSTPVEYQDFVPSPFGGEPLPNRVQFVLKTLDKSQGRAVISWRETVLPKELQTAMNKGMKDLAGQFGKAIKDKDLSKTITIENAAEFTVDTSSGWPAEVRHTQTVKADGKSREEFAFQPKRYHEVPY